MAGREVTAGDSEDRAWGMWDVRSTPSAGHGHTGKEVSRQRGQEGHG